MNSCSCPPGGNQKPSYVLYPTTNGGTAPSGFAWQNGRLVSVGVPANWQSLTPYDAMQRGFTVMTPGQVADAQQSIATGTNGAVSSQYSATDIPGNGATALSRLERPGGIGGAGVTYSITFKNNNASPVATYRVFGDWPGTYAIAKSLAPVAGDTLTILGTAGTLSLSHFTNRALARPFRVSQIQITATTGAAYFNSNPVSYFDTTPSPLSGMVQDVLPLSALPNASQYNPNIQIYDQPEIFDGTNGLYIAIPAGEVVTYTFTIVSERKANNMNLFSNGC